MSRCFIFIYGTICYNHKYLFFNISIFNELKQKELIIKISYFKTVNFFKFQIWITNHYLHANQYVLKLVFSLLLRSIDFCIVLKKKSLKNV